MVYGDLALHQDDEGLLGDILRILGSIAESIADETGVERGEGLVKLGLWTKGGGGVVQKLQKLG